MIPIEEVIEEFRGNGYPDTPEMMDTLKHILAGRGWVVEHGSSIEGPLVVRQMTLSEWSKTVWEAKAILRVIMGIERAMIGGIPASEGE